MIWFFMKIRWFFKKQFSKENRKTKTSTRLWRLTLTTIDKNFAVKQIKNVAIKLGKGKGKGNFLVKGNMSRIFAERQVSRKWVEPRELQNCNIRPGKTRTRFKALHIYKLIKIIIQLVRVVE